MEATLRYIRLVGSQFYYTFILVAILLVVGMLLFHRVRFAELGGRNPDYLESLFAAYALFAFQTAYPLPSSAGLRIVYFTYPLIGLALIAEAVVRVTLLLFSRQENQKEWTKVLASTYRDHVILCGLGRVGFRILERLQQYQIDVVVIEKDEQSIFLQRVQRLQVPVLLLDAKQEESLEQAGLRHARALIIATNDDLANVEIALDARRLRPDIKVVLRMFDETIANKLREAFHLDVAFSSAASAAPMVAASVLDLEILGSFSLDDEELFTARISIEEGSPLCGCSVAALESEHQVVVVSCKHAGQPGQLNPTAQERAGAGDQLVLHGALDRLRKLSQLSRRGTRTKRLKP